MMCESGHRQREAKRTNHHFVKDRASTLAHLVEFIDAADPVVGQNKRTTGLDRREMSSRVEKCNGCLRLKDQLTCFGIFGNVGS